MIEGDDKVREKRCGQALQQTLATFKATMVPEVLISNGEIIERIKVELPDHNDALGLKRCEAEIARVLNEFDCIMFQTLTIAHGQQIHGVKTKAIPRS